MPKLNYDAYQNAESIILRGEVDQKSVWAQTIPKKEAQEEFLSKNGMTEYAKWFLAVETDEPEDNPNRLQYLYGDFKKVHRSAILAIQAMAEKQNDTNIVIAAKELLRQIDKEPDSVEIASDDSFPASDPPPH
jgi:hypothetical protein